MPFISAQSWTIHDGKTGDLLWSKSGNQVMEMASLTKIMTIYTVMSLVKKYNIEMETTIVTVPRGAVLLGGTTAFLNEGD